jgi:hypothetical protein
MSARLQLCPYVAHFLWIGLFDGHFGILYRLFSTNSSLVKMYNLYPINFREKNIYKGQAGFKLIVIRIMLRI